MISWTSTGATSCISHNFDTKGAISGSKVVVFKTTTKILVIGTGPGGKDSADVTVNIKEIMRLGSYYQGGIIFFVDDTGQHGLIAAVIDQTDSTKGANWWNAVMLCQNYRGGGFTDWRLPNKDEERLLYQNRKLVGKFVGPKYDPHGIYWSSTELDSNWSFAISFNDNGKESWSFKEGTPNTRAIRSF